MPPKLSRVGTVQLKRKRKHRATKQPRRVFRFIPAWSFVKTRDHLFAVYEVVCQSGRRYIGETDNPDRRFQEHAEGKSRAAMRTMSFDIKFMHVLRWYTTRQAARLAEDEIQKEVGIRFGKDLVRGGHNQLPWAGELYRPR